MVRATILTKLGDITDRLTRNLSETFKAYPIIKHYVTAQSNVFCPIFITISNQLQYPSSFLDSCKSPIDWKDFTNFQNDLIQLGTEDVSE